MHRYYLRSLARRRRKLAKRWIAATGWSSGRLIEILETLDADEPEQPRER
jgi:hypothetical protein